MISLLKSSMSFWKLSLYVQHLSIPYCVSYSQEQELRNKILKNFKAKEDHRQEIEREELRFVQILTQLDLLIWLCILNLKLFVLCFLWTQYLGKYVIFIKPTAFAALFIKWTFYVVVLYILDHFPNEFKRYLDHGQSCHDALIISYSGHHFIDNHWMHILFKVMT